MKFICTDEKHVQNIRMHMQKQDGMWEEAAWELRRLADSLMEEGPWSVVNASRRAPGGDPHDYLSEAPYFWPNPEDPDGPYIRRDGEIYPGRFDEHHEWLGKLGQTVLILAESGYYLREKKYLDRAAMLLRVWFLDESTRMNPHWRYGQAIHGICDGRPIGIIEIGSVDKIVYSLGFFTEDEAYADLLAGMKKWIGELLDWLLIPGGFGEDEWLHGNNHSTWCVAHMAMFAALLDRRDVVEKCAGLFRTELLGQIAADGSLPLELERTRSYHYSRFALDPFAVICEVAYAYGINLWECENEAGGSLRRAADYIMPAMENPFVWKYPQILDDPTDDSYFFQIAALRLNLPACSEVNRRRRRGYKLIRMQEPFGPLCLLHGCFEE